MGLLTALVEWVTCEITLSSSSDSSLLGLLSYRNFLSAPSHHLSSCLERPDAFLENGSSSPEEQLRWPSVPAKFYFQGVKD